MTLHARRTFQTAILAGIVGLSAVGGCGDDDETGAGAADAATPPQGDGAAPEGSADAADAAPALVGCADLTSLVLPASSIGLPTSGAVVSAARMVAVGDGGVGAGPYCLASASIMPVDKTAPPIMLHVALPTTWNGKGMLLGGAGFDGTIPDVAANPLNTLTTLPTPLAAGYAVFASDSGHESTSPLPVLDGSFLTNQEAYENWVGDAVKKTHDVALEIIRATYGSSPQRTYVVGSSTGGREALAGVSRWPADWDGAVALYPGRNITVAVLGMTAMARELAAPGAFPNAAKRKALNDAVLAACDALDGAADGVVTNITGCNAIFDPATAAIGGVALRCAGGADTGDTCLSDAQINAIKAINAAVPLGFTPASGETSFGGYNVYAAADGVGTATPIEANVELVDFGAAPPAFPFDVSTGMSLSDGFSDGFVRFAATGNASFDYLTFDPASPGTYAAQLTKLSMLDVADTDLSGFAAKGGKLLVLQGTADLLISPRETERYITAVTAGLGPAASSSLRYYEVAGFQHASSTTFNAAWDQVGALERWVEKGTDPAENEVVTDTIGVPGRTRPLCLYPRIPKYAGTGDMNLAASFTCASP